MQNGVKFTGLSFVSTSCTVHTTSFAVIESKIHRKLCKIHVKFSRALKNAHIKDLLGYFPVSSCEKDPLLLKK